VMSSLFVLAVRSSVLINSAIIIFINLDPCRVHLNAPFMKPFGESFILCKFYYVVH